MEKYLSLFVLLNTLMSPVAYAGDTTRMTLTSSDFDNKKNIPTLYTCDGQNISPELKWNDKFPRRTESLVLVVSDQDAIGGTFYHWVVYNIPKDIHSFAKGMKDLPAGVKVGKNSWGKNQYQGPCPPKGETHRYTFTLYATDNKLDKLAPEDADGKAVLDAISDHVIGAIDLTGIYSRNK